MMDVHNGALHFKLGPDAPPIIKRVLNRKGWVESAFLPKSPSKLNSPTKSTQKSPSKSTITTPNKKPPSKIDSDWCLFWRLDRFLPSEMEACLPNQKVNHFPKSMEITRKDNLQRNLRKNKTIFGNIYSFFPETYSLPSEKKSLELAFKENKPNGKNVWICKPRDLSRGRDIKVVNNIKSLEFRHSSVVQRYIDNPALVAGYKYDLRLYVLVTCLDPLTIYLYEDGFVRLSTKKYSMENVDDTYCHLTNCSINKENPSLTPLSENNEEEPNFAATVTNILGEGAPPKWKLSQLREHLRVKENIDDVALWEKIKSIINLTILCLCSEKISPVVASSCFELFGFDILFDSNMQPWLLEVNFSPSMGCDCSPDFAVKESMINGLVDTLEFEGNKGPFSPGKGGFELIFPFNDKTRELAHSKQSMINVKGIVEELKAQQRAKHKPSKAM